MEISTEGDFKYSDLSNPNQLNMFEVVFEEQYSQQLANEIYSIHKGSAVSKEDLLNDLAWNPMCIERHLTRALRILENERVPHLIARVSNRKRKNTYPDGCIIKFS